MNTSELEQRRIVGEPFVLRDAQAVGRGGSTYTYLEGRAVPFDTFTDLGLFLEQHDAASFVKSTKSGTGQRLPLLLFHENRSFPIGVSESWTHDDGGLDGVWRLNGEAETQRAAKAADDGELRGMSIGFAPIRSAWTYVEDWNPDLGPEHKDRVTRLESRLLEVSLTPTPAFADAEISLVRTAWTIENRHAAARAAGIGGRRPAVDAWREIVEGLRSPQH